MSLTHRTRYLQSLGLHQAVLKCLEGEPVAGEFFIKPGTNNVPSPPAMLPFWGDGEDSDGLWIHWLVNRPLSFVSLSQDFQFSVSEEARTVEQYFDLLIQQEVERDYDGVGVPQAALRLASILDRHTTEILHKLSLNNILGYAEELAELPSFANEVPLSAIIEIESYDGYFPALAMNNRSRWETCCEIEARDIYGVDAYRKNPSAFAKIEAEWRQFVKDSPWLAEGTDKPDVFKHYLERGDFGQAWLSLNAHGWTISKATDALKQLQRKVLLPGFDLMVAAWDEMVPEWTVRDLF